MVRPQSLLLLGTLLASSSHAQVEVAMSVNFLLNFSIAASEEEFLSSEAAAREALTFFRE